MSGSDIECFLETITGAAFFDCFRKAVEQSGAHRCEEVVSESVDPTTSCIKVWDYAQGTCS